MYKIRFIGDPILRKKTTKVEEFGDNIKTIIENMISCMHRDDGIGLAAPQVGLTQSVLVVDISGLEKDEHPKAFINPEIIEVSGESVVEEGCLSIPGVREDVTRPDQIKLTYQDESGKKITAEYDGWMARVLQHEIDHLNGILFVDHISPIKRKMLINQEAIPENY